MTDSAEFLRKAIQHAGLRNHSDLSRKIYAWLGKKSSDHTLVYKVLNGTRRLRVDEMRAISAITGYDEHVTSGLQRMAPVVGFVTHGQKVVFLDNHQEAKMPPGASHKTRAVEIRDDSLGSALNGWYAYYSDLSTAPSKNIYQQLCVVCAADGEIYIRKVMPGKREGLYDLWGSYGDPILDVKLIWAEPVTAMMPSSISNEVKKRA